MRRVAAALAALSVEGSGNQMRSGCSAMGVAEAEQFHVQVTGTGKVTVSWASPPKYPVLLQHGLLPQTDVGNQKLQVRAEGSAVVHEIVPEGTRYFFHCGAIEQQFRGGRPCLLPEYSSPVLLDAQFDVEPETTYHYRVIRDGPSKAELSTWRSFRSPPERRGKALRLAVVGDLGQDADSVATCRAVRQLNAANGLDLGVLVGDLSYADGNATAWDTFQRMFDREGCADIPWVVMPGNHDIEPDQASEQPFLNYRGRWRAPEVKQEVISKLRVLNMTEQRFDSTYDYGASFYSLDVGPAHLVVLNPYTSADETSPQITWLREDLERVERNATPYVLAFTHAPWHHTAPVHRTAWVEGQGPPESGTVELMQHAEPLLAAAKYEALFAGHVHGYERMKPIHGTTHFVVGNGGPCCPPVDGLLNQVNENFPPISPTSGAAMNDGGTAGLGVLEIAPRSATDPTPRAYWTAYASHDLRALDTVTLLSRAAELTHPRTQSTAERSQVNERLAAAHHPSAFVQLLQRAAAVEGGSAARGSSHLRAVRARTSRDARGALSRALSRLLRRGA